MIRLIILSFVSLLCCVSFSPLSENQSRTSLLIKHFNKEQIKTANTAKAITYMTNNEKNVITLMNLSRLYPKTFASYYKDNLIHFDPSGYKKFKLKNRYYHSLYRDLIKLDSTRIKAFKPNQAMFNLAKCWALESGKKGVTGHRRRECKSGYSAECCSYSYTSNAIHHVFLLLIDEGIRDLGHRKIMLGNYSSVGVSQQDHKKYGYCFVLNFAH